MTNIDPTTPVPPETGPAAEGPSAPTGNDMEVASQQMGEGLKQFAAGAKNFLQNTARPAAVAAMSSARQKTEEAIKASQMAGPSGTTRGRAIAFLALPVAAFVTLLGLFLPAATAAMFGVSQSITVFQALEDNEAGSGGTLVMVLLLWLAVTIGGALIHKPWIRIVNGVGAIVAGLAFGWSGFTILGSLSDLTSNARGMSATPGSGLLLIILAAAVALAAGVVLLVPARTADHNTTPAPAPVEQPRGMTTDAQPGENPADH